MPYDPEDEEGYEDDDALWEDLERTDDRTNRIYRNADDDDDDDDADDDDDDDDAVESRQ